MQDTKRYSGICKRFGYQKRYGFITSKCIKGEIFVHQNSINVSSYFSDGRIRCLNVGECVEFNLVRLADGRKKALNVTGPNGTPVQGSYSQKTLCHEIMCISSTLQTVQSEKNALNQRNQTLVKNIKKLESAMNMQQQNNDPNFQKLLNEQIISLKTANTHIRNKCKQIQCENDTLKNTLQITKSEKQSLQTYFNENESLNERKMNQLSNQIQELQQINNALRNESEYKYNELTNKYNEQKRKFGYKSWDSKDITTWIINIDRTRFSKYCNDLLRNMTNEGIDGTCLANLTRDELKGLGVIQFKDRVTIFNAIQQLTESKYANEKAQYSTKEVEGSYTHYI